GESEAQKRDAADHSMFLLILMPQFYAVIVTGVLQRGEFPMNQLEMSRVTRKTSRSKGVGAKARCHTGCLVNSIEAGDFSGEERVSGELIAQRCQHSPGSGRVFVAHIGNGQEDARERSQILTVVGGQL